MSQPSLAPNFPFELLFVQLLMYLNVFCLQNCLIFLNDQRCNFSRMNGFNEHNQSCAFVQNFIQPVFPPKTQVSVILPVLMWHIVKSFYNFPSGFTSFFFPFLIIFASTRIFNQTDNVLPLFPRISHL